MNSRETSIHEKERSLASLVAEIRDEVKSSLNTRLRMVRAEIKETAGAFKVGAPLGFLCLLMVGTGFLMLTLALVALIALAFAGNPFAWVCAFLIVGVLYLALAAIAGFIAYNEFRGRFPNRTIEVLKADKVWLQSEARIHT